jgi:osmotically-inducible protein OsmY
MKKAMNKKTLATAVCALSLIGGGLMTVGCSTAPQQESAGQYMDSSVITTKVKSKLLADKSVKSFPITVSTYKNVVQLSGFVNTNAEAEKAVSLTKSVPGVEAVKNSLLVKNQ